MTSNIARVLPLYRMVRSRMRPVAQEAGALHGLHIQDQEAAAAAEPGHDADLAPDPVPYVEPVDYRPTGSVTVPSGLKARAQANIDALRVAHLCAEQNRAATRDEQEVLVQWSGWGALPGMFADDHDVLADERAELRELLDEAMAASAERVGREPDGAGVKIGLGQAGVLADLGAQWQDEDTADETRRVTLRGIGPRWAQRPRV